MLMNFVTGYSHSTGRELSLYDSPFSSYSKMNCAPLFQEIITYYLNQKQSKYPSDIFLKGILIYKVSFFMDSSKLEK